MKLTQPTPRGGSFGIPEHLRPEALLKERADRDAREAKRDEAAAEGPAEHHDDGFVASDDEKPAEPLILTPVETLKKLGIDFTPEDYTKLFWQGSIDKDIEVGFDPVEQKPIMATIRTLTPADYDGTDVCFGEDISSRPVTAEGARMRKQAWQLAFGFIAIDGAKLVKKDIMMQDPKDLSKQVVDVVAMAKARHARIASMSVHLVNKVMQAADDFNIQLKMIMEDPKGAFLQRP